MSITFSIDKGGIIILLLIVVQILSFVKWGDNQREPQPDLLDDEAIIYDETEL